MTNISFYQYQTTYEHKNRDSPYEDVKGCIMGNNYRSNNGRNTNIEEKVERKVKVIFKVLYNQCNELKIEEEGN